MTAPDGMPVMGGDVLMEALRRPGSWGLWRRAAAAMIDELMGEVDRLTAERDALRRQAAIGERAQRIAENVRPEYGDNCGHERAAWVDGYNHALDNVLAGAPVPGAPGVKR